MELKAFQKDVIEDISCYLDLIADEGNYKTAFQRFWATKDAPTLGWYQDTIPGAPAVCFKIPTGGGKTFTAAAAIKPVFNALPQTRYRTVVWLVPSLPILEQTVRALKDRRHPYRQRLDADFQSHIEVYTKDELLSGQNFSPGVIANQLSVMVLSYDSFKPTSKRDKEALKAYQSNGALLSFRSALGSPEHPVENADEQSLFQILNQLNPVVVVDESHHAKTPLSLEMLRNFNPAMVLEFTATPRPESNVLSYVDALQLKQESMVKLPMIVYNRRQENDVLIDTIALRDTLERLAKENEQRGAQYIRPIALFQAQPRTASNAYTHDRIRVELEKAGIAPEQIAVRTADINELKGVDLMSPSCPIRYIITVNALTEGWDCPFAYVLASTANRSTRISVEQIIGRILRQPYTREQPALPLNMSYVLTCSDDFDTVVRDLVENLHYIGFSKKDFRAIDIPETEKSSREPEHATDDLKTELPEVGSDSEKMRADHAEEEESASGGGPDVVPVPAIEPTVSNPSVPASDGAYADGGFNGEAAKEELHRRNEQKTADPASSMLDQAERELSSFNADMRRQEKAGLSVSPEQEQHMSHIRMRPAFAASASALRLPQFFLKPEPLQGSWFTDELIELDPVLLSPVNLATGFTLAKAPISMQFVATDSDVYKIDADAQGGVPTAFMQNDMNRERWLSLFHERSEARQKRDCVQQLMHSIGSLNMISHKDLTTYVRRAVDTMSADVRAATYISPSVAAGKIRDGIRDLLNEHYRKKFRQVELQNRLLCRPYYAFPEEIHPVESVNVYANSLYEAEDAHMNSLEKSLAEQLAVMPKVCWWHRNPENKPDSFRINGFLSHYPDFVIYTTGGFTILAETKGLHLNPTASMERLTLGKTWEKLAGLMYRYYMVFEDGPGIPDGGVSMSEFVDILNHF